jgi:hypothetical protein
MLGTASFVSAVRQSLVVWHGCGFLGRRHVW